MSHSSSRRRKRCRIVAGNVAPAAHRRQPIQHNLSDSRRRLSTKKTLQKRLKSAREVAAVSSRRITRGLGVFAGADFPCDSDRDAFIGAPWARGACLLKCDGRSSGGAPLCEHAIIVCARLSMCTTVDINVEGTVATLKQETDLSRRTSWVKEVKVRRHKANGNVVVGQRGPVDGPCPEHEVELPELTHQPSCVLDCPLLNCTRGIERCYQKNSCVAVDISFGVHGHAAIARLRFNRSQATWLSTAKRPG